MAPAGRTSAGTGVAGPGRLGARERDRALAAPGEFDGFVSRRYRLDGLRLHVRQRLGTDPASTPCVLVHGLAVSHRSLMPTAHHLRPERTVYVPDLPGFGLSDKPRRVLDVGGHARVLTAWLETLGTAPVALLGHSFGGQVAVELAARRPDLVAALVLVGPSTDTAAASMIRQVGRFLRDLPREDPRQAAILRADLADAGARRVVVTLRHAVRDRIDTKLPTLDVPVLLARGAQDRLAPQPWLDRLTTLAPDARTLVLGAAAHNAVTTAGPELARAVEELLSEVTSPR